VCVLMYESAPSFSGARAANTFPPEAQHYTTRVGLDNEDAFPSIKVVVTVAGAHGAAASRAARSRLYGRTCTRRWRGKGSTRIPIRVISAPRWGGFGYGLSLSRLYARYLGGDLRLIAMEGYGTDVYVRLNRLSSSREPLP
jgi:pyruvate dehydrogenase kinase 2/3/4